MFSKFTFLKYAGIICFLFSNACRNKDKNNLDIEFSKDSSAIVITQIAPAGLYALKESFENGDSVEIISVIESPGENDSLSREIEISGRTEIHEKSVWFFPQTPFVKNKNYLISTPLNMYLGNTKEMLQSRMNLSGKPQEKRLIR